MHKDLLFRKSETDKQKIRFYRVDLLNYGIFLFEIPVMSTDNTKTGKHFLHVFSGFFRDTGLGTKEKNTAVSLCQLFKHTSGKIDSGHSAFQRCAKNLGTVDHPDPVRKDKAGCTERILKIFIMFRFQNYLRIWCDNIGRIVLFHQGKSLLYGLFQ